MNQDAPLFIAIKEGKLSKVKKLLKKGVDINTKTDYHKTLLGVAIYYGKINIVKLLISKGADVNAADEKGSILHMAAEFDTKEHRQIAELLIKAGADVNAKTKKQIDQFDLELIERGLMENDKEASTRPLHEAVKTVCIKLVKLLISKGADVNAKNERLTTPLNFAAKQGNKDIAKLLISKGADVNAQNTAGKTPLTMALKEGHKKVVKLLKKHKAH